MLIIPDEDFIASFTKPQRCRSMKSGGKKPKTKDIRKAAASCESRSLALSSWAEMK
jgi:hypothetical protein